MTRDHGAASEGDGGLGNLQGKRLSGDAQDGTGVDKSTFDVSLDENFGGANAGSSRRRIPTGTLLMGVVIAASAASLWSMRAIDRAAASGPRASKEVEELVKGAIDHAKNPRTAEVTDATRLLEPTEASDDLRVPLKDLAKNPFVIWMPPTEVKQNPADPETPVDNRADRIAEWQATVDAAAGVIRVQSTMSGTGPQGATGIANINGHMMRIGDVFGVDKSDIEFVVDAIERDTVTFRAWNAELKHERKVTVKVNRKW